ncbi:MAG: MBL fold metallo-hydrolase [Campylobacterales bacterium]|nr:MBL fold metallo-hydrolase [Campylobacterales bacterium]
MQVKVQPMGPYQTNCYIATVDGKDFIIDPGVGAVSWVLKNVKNPVAILNTHGHFDHVWSNKELKEKLNLPIYIPEDDAFMLENDPFEQGTPSSRADRKIKSDEVLDIAGVKVKFLHFGGHTPGSSVIEIGNSWFSGDFLFEGSIGRWDFPYSSAKDMVKSLKKVSDFKENFKIYPGHGGGTTLTREMKYIPYWIEQVRRTASNK